MINNPNSPLLKRFILHLFANNVFQASSSDPNYNSNVKILSYIK